MIKHTIEISQRPARLSLKNKQLIIKLNDVDRPRQFACEDIGILILQHPAVSLSAAVLNALLESGAAIIFCNGKHLPSGILLPTLAHTELVPRMMNQIAVGKPAKKQTWKAIVQAKIYAQANELEDPSSRKLLRLSQNVKSGDSENAEAQAAKIYWSARFPDRYQIGDKRDPDGNSLFNLLLNYGYAIIRAAVARAIVAAGLQPALGVFHHRRDNPFCLADDLMEPLRPLVDRTVYKILSDLPNNSSNELTADHRREILALLSYPVAFQDQKGPLMATLPRYIASFYRHLIRESDHLDYPVY